MGDGDEAASGTAIDVAAAAAGRTADVPWQAWAIGAALVAVELAFSGRYGYEQDELYFLVAGHHLAFGYVDQPPLTPLLTRITGILGVSPTAVRVIPALAGGAVAVSAAKFAALFGARRFGRILASLATACAPVVIGAAHESTTTPLDLLAWTLVLLSVTIALLREAPRWWLAAGAAAGVGLENKSLLVLLVIGLGLGLLASGNAAVLRSRWPWLGAAIAGVIWAPNLIWQAAHGWPQLAMASALHREHSAVTDYVLAVPAQFLYAGLLVIPLLIAGYIRLWRTRELRFVAVAVTVIVVYVVAWVPGRPYYTDGMVPAVLAAGSVTAERRIAAARRPGASRGWWLAAPLIGAAAALPVVLPVLPVGHLHDVPGLHKLNSDIGDTVGWPQLVGAVAAADAELTRSGRPPGSVFAEAYGEAAALDVYGSAYHLPPVLSGDNTYWMWGPGRASDQTVLVVDALGELRPYFARCRVLTTYDAPYQVQNDWTGVQIGVCTGPAADWRVLWPHLRFYG